MEVNKDARLVTSWCSPGLRRERKDMREHLDRMERIYQDVTAQKEQVMARSLSRTPGQLTPFRRATDPGSPALHRRIASPIPSPSVLRSQKKGEQNENRHNGKMPSCSSAEPRQSLSSLRAAQPWNPVRQSVTGMQDNPQDKQASLMAFSSVYGSASKSDGASQHRRETTKATLQPALTFLPSGNIGANWQTDPVSVAEEPTKAYSCVAAEIFRQRYNPLRQGLKQVSQPASVSPKCAGQGSVTAHAGPCPRDNKDCTGRVCHPDRRRASYQKQAWQPDVDVFNVEPVASSGCILASEHGYLSISPLHIKRLPAEDEMLMASPVQGATARVEWEDTAKHAGGDLCQQPEKQHRQLCDGVGPVTGSARVVTPAKPHHSAPAELCTPPLSIASTALTTPDRDQQYSSPAVLRREPGSVQGTRDGPPHSASSRLLVMNTAFSPARSSNPAPGSVVSGSRDRPHSSRLKLAPTCLAFSTESLPLEAKPCDSEQDLQQGHVQQAPQPLASPAAQKPERVRCCRSPAADTSSRLQPSLANAPHSGTGLAAKEPQSPANAADHASQQQETLDVVELRHEPQPDVGCLHQETSAPQLDHQKHCIEMPESKPSQLRGAPAAAPSVPLAGDGQQAMAGARGRLAVGSSRDTPQGMATSASPGAPDECCPPSQARQLPRDQAFCSKIEMKQGREDQTEVQGPSSMQPAPSIRGQSNGAGASTSVPSRLSALARLKSRSLSRPAASPGELADRPPPAAPSTRAATHPPAVHAVDEPALALDRQLRCSIDSSATTCNAKSSSTAGKKTPAGTNLQGQELVLPGSAEAGGCAIPCPSPQCCSKGGPQHHDEVPGGDHPAATISELGPADPAAARGAPGMGSAAEGPPASRTAGDSGNATTLLEAGAALSEACAHAVHEAGGWRPATEETPPSAPRPFLRRRSQAVVPLKLPDWSHVRPRTQTRLDNDLIRPSSSRGSTPRSATGSRPSSPGFSQLNRTLHSGRPSTPKCASGRGSLLGPAGSGGSGDTGSRLVTPQPSSLRPASSAPPSRPPWGSGRGARSSHSASASRAQHQQQGVGRSSARTTPFAPPSGRRCTQVYQAASLFEDTDCSPSMRPSHYLGPASTSACQSNRGGRPSAAPEHGPDGVAEGRVGGVAGTVAARVGRQPASPAWDQLRHGVPPEPVAEGGGRGEVMGKGALDDLLGHVDRLLSEMKNY